MARAQRGSLRIVAVQDQQALTEAAALLAAADDIPQDDAESRLKHLPMTLREDIARPEADEIAQYLHELGVEARFLALEQRQKKRKAAAQAETKRQKTQASSTPLARTKTLSAQHALMLPALLFAAAVGVVVWMLVGD